MIGFFFGKKSPGSRNFENGDVVLNFSLFNASKNSGEDNLTVPHLHPLLPPVCSETEFQCSRRQCVQASQVCDGVTDCKNGKDEIDCPVACTVDQFTCGNGACISGNQVCDGVSDCVGGEDELQCRKSSLINLYLRFPIPWG